jgi:hypothetical protein
MARIRSRALSLRAKRPLQFEQLEDRRLWGINVIGTMATLVAIGALTDSIPAAFIGEVNDQIHNAMHLEDEFHEHEITTISDDEADLISISGR